MIRRRNFLKSLAALTLVPGMRAAGRSAPTGRMNVLLVTADDLGTQLGAYGDALAVTPNIDRLAASGVRFDRAWVTQSSCSPSRSSIFTGLYAHSTGQVGLAGAGFELNPGLVDRTIPNLLRRAGYRTGIIGKLHVAPENGFDFEFRRTRITRDVDWMAEQARRFLKGPGDRPFFLMVNYVDPHIYHDRSSGRWFFPESVRGRPADPVSPGRDTLLPFQGIDSQEQRLRTAGYYTAIRRLDDGIGMLFELLERSGHAEETMVVFLSDQGPPFARAKTTVYEAGIRVPLIIRWPGVTSPGASSALVSTVDILPTILDSAGLSPDADLHGESLRPLLADRAISWRQYIMAESHFHGRRPFYPRRAIRDSRFKLINNLLAGSVRPGVRVDGDDVFQISRGPQFRDTPAGRALARFADPPEWELYDLDEDPVEFINRAGDPDLSAIRKRLEAALLMERQRTDDPLLDPETLARARRDQWPPTRD